MIYLDNAATTLMDPEIISSLQGYMHDHFANSGAVYEIGLDAKKKIEEATESIEVAGQTFLGDVVALRKNHDMTIVPYPELTGLETYTLTIVAADASDNTNTSSVNLVIDEDDATSPLPVDDSDLSETEDGSDEKADLSALFGDPIIQIALLLVVLMILTAFIRTRKHELDYSTPVEDDLLQD